MRVTELAIEGGSFSAGYVRPIAVPFAHQRENRRVQFGILGPVQVTRDGAVVDLGGARRMTLLAALLVRTNRTCPVDYLVEVLWGDHPPAAAAATLHSHIAHLRKTLEPDRPPRETSTILKSTQNGYQLVVDPANLDAGMSRRG